MWYLIVSIPDLCTLTYLERLILLLHTCFVHINQKSIRTVIEFFHILVQMCTHLRFCVYVATPLSSQAISQEVILVARFEPCHEISNNVVCVTSKGSDQPAHMRSLFRAFTSRLNILRVLSYLLNIILSF